MARKNQPLTTTQQSEENAALPQLDALQTMLDNAPTSSENPITTEKDQTAMSNPQSEDNASIQQFIVQHPVWQGLKLNGKEVYTLAGAETHLITVTLPKEQEILLQMFLGAENLRLLKEIEFQPFKMTEGTDNANYAYSLAGLRSAMATQFVELFAQVINPATLAPQFGGNTRNVSVAVSAFLSFGTSKISPNKRTSKGGDSPRRAIPAATLVKLNEWKNKHAQALQELLTIAQQGGLYGVNMGVSSVVLPAKYAPLADVLNALPSSEWSVAFNPINNLDDSEAPDYVQTLAEVVHYRYKAIAKAGKGQVEVNGADNVLDMMLPIFTTPEDYTPEQKTAIAKTAQAMIAQLAESAKTETPTTTTA